MGLTKSDNVIINNAGTWQTTGTDLIGLTANTNAETITNKSGGVIGTAFNGRPPPSPSAAA